MNPIRSHKTQGWFNIWVSYITTQIEEQMLPQNCLSCKDLFIASQFSEYLHSTPPRRLMAETKASLITDDPTMHIFTEFPTNLIQQLAKVFAFSEYLHLNRGKILDHIKMCLETRLKYNELYF